MSSGYQRAISGVSHMAGRLVGKDLAARLLGPGLFALIIKVASAGVSYLMLVAFAHLMDAQEYGHFGLSLNLVVLLASVVGLGLPTLVMRLWPEHMAKGELGLAAGLSRSSLIVLALTCAALIAVGIAASALGIGATMLGFSHGAAAVAILAAAYAFGDFLSGLLRAQNQTVWSLAPRDIGWRVITPLCAFAAAWWYGEINAEIAIGICIVVMLAVIAGQLVKERRTSFEAAAGVAPRSNWPVWRRSLFPLWGASVLYAMIQQLDVVVVGWLLGANEAGAYFAAQKTASLLGLAMIAGGLVAAPVMAATYHTGKFDELQRVCRMLAIAIAATTLAGFAVLVFAGAALLNIFDPHYVSAYHILLILAFGYAIDAMAGPSAYLMQMTSLEWVYLRVMAIVYVFVLALQITFVPRYGIAAAAIASAAGVIIWNCLAIYLLRTKIGIDPSILSVFLRARKMPR